ncbi:MAG TPA: aspartyl/asparaginyl beta-hydroxylase domain-containing protein [Pseudolabrys sp.]|nr:aspartyl/asparaginyl beta-hydroxylase domain-containing protein [Pseudolabrys sp.]
MPQFLTRVYDRAGDALRAFSDSRIDTPAILDTATFFPAAPRFVENWQKIRDEALAIRARLASVPRFHDIMPSQADISANDGRDWRIFIMKAYGVEFPENMSQAPFLKSLIADVPEILSCSFSFLAPGKHIPRHRGPFRGITRFHLMLSMPNGADGVPACVLYIDDKPYRLGDGQSLLWDDTFPHEVLNSSDQVRIALLFDVWRPHMPTDMDLLSRLIVFVVQSRIRLTGFAPTG